MHYRNKLDTLKAMFGREDIALDENELKVGKRVYPIVDDVIVLLEPEFYPPTLRKRMGLVPAAQAGQDESFAEDIQFSFGEEWKTHPRILPEHEREFRQYFDLVDLGSLAGKRVCDLGCGIGRWSYFLKDVAGELVLVDFSEAVFVARHNLADVPNALFFMADIKRLPFAPNFADFLFCLGVLHHLPTPALKEVRALRRYAPILLVYLYYALDNRPAYFRGLLALVTGLRKALSRVRSGRMRTVITNLLAVGVYLPMMALGSLLNPLGLGRWAPLFEGYRGKSLGRIRQDAYDRFFTRIEQRVSREEILTLKDSFTSVTVSGKLPYWHFLCRR